LADQLQFSHESIESVFERAHRLLHEVMSCGERVLLQHVGGNRVEETSPGATRLEPGPQGTPDQE
jgi:hypothetical protein